MAQQKVFLAGAATSNITPELGGGIVGNFGIPPAAAHIHDELHARCLVLDDGTKQLVFVIADNLSIPREVFDEAKRQIQEATGIPKEHMLMAATHTHSGTSAGGEGERRRGWNTDGSLDAYQRFVAQRIVDGVRVAINNKVPAQIGWGKAELPQHVFNRRWKMKPGTENLNPFGGRDQVVMNPGVGNPNLLEPAGPTDPEVSFISVKSKEGKPLAVLANYSLHYIGGVPRDHISADYFAVFAERLGQMLGADHATPPFVAIMSNGTSADVNNINFRGPAEKMEPYQKMKIVADDVAKEVFHGYQNIKYHDWVPLKAAQSELRLNVRKPSPELMQWARNIQAKPDSVKPVHRLEKTYAERLFRVVEWPDQVSVVLQTLAIGDLGIAAIPFETFAETGLELKAKSPFKTSFNIELANGWYGYLPTPEQHKLGGYETWLSTNYVETEATRKIVAELLKLYSQLK